MSCRLLLAAALRFGICFAASTYADIPADYTGTPFAGEPLNGQPQQIPGEIKAAYFDQGGDGIAFHDGTPENIGGSNRTLDADKPVDMQPFNDMDYREDGSREPAGTYHLSWVKPGEWLKFTVDVQTSGVYDVDFHQAVAELPNKTSITIDDGTPIEQVDVPKSTIPPGCPEIWHCWKVDAKLAEVTLSAGLHVLRLDFIQGDWNFDALIFTLAQETPAGQGKAPAADGGLSAFQSGDALNITFSLPRPGTVSFRLFDIKGQSMLPVVKTPGTAGLQSATLPLNGLASGVYRLQMEQNGSVTSRLLPFYR